MTFLGIRQKVVGSSDEIPTKFFFLTKRYRRTGRHGKLTGDCVLVIEAKLVRLLKRVIVSPDLHFEMVISRSLLLSGQSLLFVA
ncbi:hypothetical protein DY000_02061580 [Brassica cretica]|uniref:Uncharacterized protein n=1 Tax=Brassica cretica TaxID=69181 RepID=A0ABQ7AP75_BRACR|nr:hypothetical protein DY000_02061580 [Brassica cretica]